MVTEMSMKNRIALVTGGMGGLGEVISMKLQDTGCRVVVTYSPSNNDFNNWLASMDAVGRRFPAY